LELLGLIGDGIWHDPSSGDKKTMGMNDSSPLNDLEIILSRWWLITLLMIAGGLVGWFISFNKPPIYEARASMVILLEQGQQGDTSDNKTSMELSNVNALISARAMGADLIANFGEKCENITNLDMQIERRESNWDLVVRCSDPQSAAELANAWVDNAFTVLEDAYQHGLKVEALSVTFDLLKSCRNDPAQELCAGFQDMNALQERIRSLRDEIGVEKQASQGINSALTFRIESHATIPVKPAANAPGALLLAGAVIGLLLGILTTTVHRRNHAKKPS
jgi:capsular polysaccharide biosynthesis protein